MQYRTFGRTGWQVSEIAFGGWQIGGDWGRVDDDDSIRTLHHAFGQGVNFVDTAELYGSGHSEDVIGRAVQQWTGTRIYVATKIQPVVWPDPADDQPQMRGRYPRWYLRAGVDAAGSRPRRDLRNLPAARPRTRPCATAPAPRPHRTAHRPARPAWRLEPPSHPGPPAVGRHGPRPQGHRPAPVPAPPRPGRRLGMPPGHRSRTRRRPASAAPTELIPDHLPRRKSGHYEVLDHSEDPCKRFRGVLELADEHDLKVGYPLA